MKMMHILLVEDNEGDILLTKEALKDANLDFDMSVVKDGKAAINFMNTRDKMPEAALINLVLLDINLPKKNGHEVLKFIKEDEKLKHIPVVMLTTSSSQKDIDLAYRYSANNYIIKPLDPEKLMKIVGSF